VIATVLLLVLCAGDADGGASLQPPEVTALSQVLDAGVAPLDLNLPHPADPFASEYQPPVAREVGPGAGQLRLFALGGATSSPDLLGQLTVESMHLSILALRGSLELELTTLGPAHPHLGSARIGVALHFVPYHRVDFSLFVDAGVAAADLFTSQRRAAPVVVAGGAIELALTSHLFLRAEGQVQWAVLPLSGSLVRGAGLLGLGWTL